MEVVNTTMYGQYTTIRIIDVVNADRLAEVKQEMAVLGAPHIRVVDIGEEYFALEGSHRLTAARDLGIYPILTILEHDEEIDCEQFDWWDFFRGSSELDGAKTTAMGAVCLLMSTDNDYVSFSDI